MPGGNYGWPDVTGAPHRTGFLDAKVVWPSTADSSPSGLEIVGDTAYLGALRASGSGRCRSAANPPPILWAISHGSTAGSGTWHWLRTADCGSSATTKTLISC